MRSGFIRTGYTVPPGLTMLTERVVITMTDIIARQIEHAELPGRGPVSLLTLHGGQVIVIGADAVAMFRDRDSISDPLGNGVLGHERLPAAQQCDASGSFVAEQRAGYVGLIGGAVLFVRPDGVALYDSGLDALHNRNAHWLIPFA